ncbi:MAG TPA: hypothetical protein VLB86_12255 [Gaiellaceae bacterium]|nr:hypothetical protein [Gaiellaceae bacterium]
MTLVAGLWTLVVAFAMAWGGAEVTAAVPALLAPAVLVAAAFLKRVPVACVLLLATAAAVVQITLAAAVAFGLWWEDAADEPSTAFASAFVAVGATPALAGLAGVWVALIRRADPAVRRTSAMLALVAFAFGSLLFWFFGLVAFEGATTGRDAADNIVDDLFFALLQAGPVLLYCAAAAVAAAAVGRPAPLRYRSWNGEAY